MQYIVILLQMMSGRMSARGEKERERPRERERDGDKVERGQWT